VKDIRVVGLAKAFGKTPAVDHVQFDAPAGSLATLLGPSGCGKTTTLRLLAGLEKPDAGEVYVGGRLLTSAARAIFVAPEKRRMGMVFQTYAIWPHMTVFENIAFPLREKRVPAAEVRERVMAMLRMLGLEGFLDRPAPLLSGGQQQRVALGRALVADPDVLLLDEPFSNLDARLREEMRLELKELQARVGVTTVFVTHDQAGHDPVRPGVRDERRADRPGGHPARDLRASALAIRHGLPGPGRSRRRAGGATPGRRLRGASGRRHRR